MGKKRDKETPDGLPGKKRVDSALRALEQMFETLGRDPLVKINQAIRQLAPPSPPRDLGLPPYERWIQEFFRTAQRAALTLGEPANLQEPPKLFIGIRPLYSGFVDEEDVVFDWEVTSTAKSYKLILVERATDRVWEVEEPLPPVNYPASFPPLDPQKRYIIKVIPLDKKGNKIGVSIGTIWILSEQKKDDFKLKLERLKSTKGAEQFWLGGLFVDFGLYDAALQYFIKLIDNQDLGTRVLGYMGAINVWQTLYRELVPLGYTQTAYQVQEEAMRLQSFLCSLMEREFGEDS